MAAVTHASFGVLDALEEAVFLLDASRGQVLDANLAAGALLGRPREELAGAPLGLLGAWEAGLREDRLRPALEALRAGESARFEFPRGEGRRFEARLRAASRDGVPVVVLVVQEVTPLRHLREESGLAAERYRLLATHLPSSAALMFDHDLRFVLADGPELARNGDSKEKLEGKLLFDAVDPAFAALVEPNLRAALGGKRFRDELPFGELLYSYTYEPLRDASGEVRYVLVLAQDVTALRRAEREAVKAEQRLRAVIDNMPAIVFAFDASGRFTFSEGLSPGGSRERAREVVGRRVEEVYAGHAKMLELAARALAGESTSADVQVNGRVWESRCAPRLDASGAVTEVVGVAWDVTDRRRAEAGVLQAQRLETVGQLAGGIAHDFNNMLAAILSAAEALQASPSEARAELCGTIVDAATRAAQLTRQLLVFSRRSKRARAPVSVDALVQETLRLLAHGLDPRVEVRAALDAPTAVVLADAAELQSALLNLCFNARDAMPSGGTLRVATRRLPGEDRVELSVSDTGVGIAEELRGRIFEPFFTTKPVGQGAGLGLAAVYGTVTALGGEVLVESELGRGSLFRVLLPCAKEAPGAPSAGDAPPAGKGLVLVVDDEPLVRQSCGRLLASLGHEVLFACDGREGVEVFARARGRLVAVLCDGKMPRLSGLEALDEMHRIDPAVPLVLCTGYAPEEGATLGEGPHVAFLAKPYKRSDLARVLASVARPRGAAEDP